MCTAQIVVVRYQQKPGAYPANVLRTNGWQ